jgi:hypothetical protein
MVCRDGAARPGRKAALGFEVRRWILTDELRRPAVPPMEIEAVTVEGCTVLRYSRYGYDWTCAPQCDNPYSCRGWAEADAGKPAVNLFLYATSY